MAHHYVIMASVVAAARPAHTRARIRKTARQSVQVMQQTKASSLEEEGHACGAHRQAPQEVPAVGYECDAVTAHLRTNARHSVRTVRTKLGRTGVKARGKAGFSPAVSQEAEALNKESKGAQEQSDSRFASYRARPVDVAIVSEWKHCESHAIACESELPALGTKQ